MQPITGAQWGERIREAARSRGMTLGQFIAPMSAQPGKWLLQLEEAERPKAETISRIQALLNDEPVAPPKAAKLRHIASYTRKAPLFAREPVYDPAPASAPRDPCVRCGVRADRHEQGGCRRYAAP